MTAARPINLTPPCYPYSVEPSRSQIRHHPYPSTGGMVDINSLYNIIQRKCFLSLSSQARCLTPLAKFHNLTLPCPHTPEPSSIDGPTDFSGRRRNQREPGKFVSSFAPTSNGASPQVLVHQSSEVPALSDTL